MAKKIYLSAAAHAKDNLTNPREFFAVLRSEVDENKDGRGDSDVH